jgi:hypothetical protein
MDKGLKGLKRGMLKTINIQHMSSLLHTIDATVFFGSALVFASFRLDFVTYTNRWPTAAAAVPTRQCSVHAEQYSSTKPPRLGQCDKWFLVLLGVCLVHADHLTSPTSGEEV